MAEPIRLLARIRGHGGVERDNADILNGALAAFLDFGIKRTSMAEVARRGGLSLATLYRRFGKKDDVVQAVGLWQVRRLLTQADASLRKQADDGASAEDQIIELFVVFALGLRQNPLLDRLLATDAATVLPYLTTGGSPVIELGRDFIAEFITRLQQDGKLPAYDPLPVAEMVARTALSLVLTRPTVIPLDDEAAARRFARDHIAPGFRPLDAQAVARQADGTH
ncbi:TetR/AcrR family transcriptional regulator [Nocardia caishijiensis]|uniref:TetR family transcriptional regulator n=1 Tax=Nocardia caishijiensis TaxID=184756 RepID=A0ABQ6YKQ5_9NOCA|nr:TetR/AcrR family transcriptional regulator [Nocardia caishijiensis]KAF0846367.1 TetR family transcriptional regulator [Nocardia caishijiensis]